MSRFREWLTVFIALAALIVGLLAWLAPFSPIGHSPIAKEVAGTQAIENLPQATVIPLPPTKILPTLLPSPTQVIPTAAPRPQSLGTIAVTANSSEGITWIAKQRGQYTFRYVGGAYSPESSAQPADKQWRTRIQVYKNRQIEWGPRQLNPQDDPNFPYREPVSPDAVFMGNYFVVTQAEATSAGKSASPLSFDLQMNDYLIFVAMDDKGFYGDNQGAVTFEVFLVPR
jgi:hypothetical protein